jgi:molybdate transport system substrate-binding protein
MRLAGFALALMVLATLTGRVRAAEPVRVYSAGSLSGVMPQLIAASGLPAGTVAPPVFGPAGLLRQRLQSGETADLFASADLMQARAAVGSDGLVVPFARNRMCMVTPGRLGITPGNLLDHMLSPAFRLATSTPGADPGGDYALAVFARADAVHPGAQATLIGKALTLVGGPRSITPLPGHGPAATIFLGDHADALL